MSFKRMIVSSITIIVAFFVLNVSASADIGPKPSIRIVFENIDGKSYYAVMLTPNQSDYYSRWSYFDDLPSEKATARDKILEYPDDDNYYPVDYIWSVTNNNNEVNIYYYTSPPEKFKILLYDISDDSFTISSICKTESLSSRYTADLHKIKNKCFDIVGTNDRMYSIMKMIGRIIFTVLIEVVVAIVMGFRKKMQLFVISGINIVTQVFLTFTLSIAVGYVGEAGYTSVYVLMEILVTIVEAVCYRLSKSMWSSNVIHTTVFALLANIASLGAGFIFNKFVFI